MARSLANKVNVQAPDSDYPYGKIKDNDGTGNGTPVNENVYGDVHQFFERLMAEAGIVHNELPDNAYTGFQFFEALEGLFLRTKIVEIGAWNMTVAQVVSVAHGLPDHTKVRSVSAMLINDDGTLLTPLDGGYSTFATNNQPHGGVSSIGVTNIGLTRNEDSSLWNTDWDDGTINRGWVTIKYAP